MLLKNNSVLYRVLSALPVCLSPYRIMAVRVGNNYFSHSKVVWGV